MGFRGLQVRRVCDCCAFGGEIRGSDSPADSLAGPTTARTRGLRLLSPRRGGRTTIQAGRTSGSVHRKHSSANPALKMKTARSPAWYEAIADACSSGERSGIEVATVRIRAMISETVLAARDGERKETYLFCAFSGDSSSKLAREHALEKRGTESHADDLTATKAPSDSVIRCTDGENVHVSPEVRHSNRSGHIRSVNGRDESDCEARQHGLSRAGTGRTY